MPRFTSRRGVTWLETQRKSLLERAGELQSHLGGQIETLDLELSTLGELTAGGDALSAAATIKLKDEKHKVEESLATLMEKTAAWEATEAARNDPTTAAAAAQWRSTAAAGRTDAKPTTPPRDATDEQLTALVAQLDASDQPTQLSAFRELYDLSAPTSDEKMRQRVRTPILV